MGAWFLRSVLPDNDCRIGGFFKFDQAYEFQIRWQFGPLLRPVVQEVFGFDVAIVVLKGNIHLEGFYFLAPTQSDLLLDLIRVSFLFQDGSPLLQE